MSVRIIGRPTHIPIERDVRDAAADTADLRRKADQVARGGARAAVLGANDGLVTNLCLILAVAGASAYAVVGAPRRICQPDRRRLLDGGRRMGVGRAARKNLPSACLLNCAGSSPATPGWSSASSRPTGRRRLCQRHCRASQRRAATRRGALPELHGPHRLRRQPQRARARPSLRPRARSSSSRSVRSSRWRHGSSRAAPPRSASPSSLTGIASLLIGGRGQQVERQPGPGRSRAAAGNRRAGVGDHLRNRRLVRNRDRLIAGAAATFARHATWTPDPADDRGRQLCPSVVVLRGQGADGGRTDSARSTSRRRSTTRSTGRSSIRSEAGLDVISDGEMRRASFVWAFCVADDRPARRRRAAQDGPDVARHAQRAGDRRPGRRAERDGRRRGVRLRLDAHVDPDQDPAARARSR